MGGSVCCYVVCARPACLSLIVSLRLFCTVGHATPFSLLFASDIVWGLVIAQSATIASTGGSDGFSSRAGPGLDPRADGFFTSGAVLTGWSSRLESVLLLHNYMKTTMFGLEMWHRCFHVWRSDLSRLTRHALPLLRSRLSRLGGAVVTPRFSLTAVSCLSCPQSWPMCWHCASASSIRCFRVCRVSPL